MVLFLKGCSTAIAEDGGHQEGEVQAGCEEGSKFCSLSIFLRVLKKDVVTRKILMLQLGELHVHERCIFLVVFLWARMSRKIGGSLACFFSGSSDLITEEVIQHYIRQVD